MSKPMMLHLKRCLYCMKSYYDEADLKRHCVSSHRASGAERCRPGSDRYVQSHQLWSVSSRKRSGPGRGRDQGSLGEQRECHRRDGRQPGTRLPPRHKCVCLLPKQQVLSIGKKMRKSRCVKGRGKTWCAHPQFCSHRGASAPSWRGPLWTH